MKFEINQAKATLRGDVRLKGREVKGSGHVTGTTLILEIDASTCRKAVEKLFPGSTLHDKEIAGRDDLLGEKRIAGTKLRDVRLLLTTGELKLPVMSLDGAELKAAAVLKTLKKEGDGWAQTLIVKPRVKLTGAEVVTATEHFDSDVFVSMEAMPELDLAELDNEDGDGGDDEDEPSGTTADPELTGEKRGGKPPKRRGKGKKAAPVDPAVRVEKHSIISKGVHVPVHVAFKETGLEWSIPILSVAEQKGGETLGEALNAAQVYVAARQDDVEGALKEAMRRG